MKTTASKPVDPWRISETDFPGEGTDYEKGEFLLQYALVAPSNHNSQPWQFQICPGSINLFCDRGRACRIVDPHDRELIMSCGCALFNLRAAMRHFGCFGHVQLLPAGSTEDLLATVYFGTETESLPDRDLFAAIFKRRTNRQRFYEQQLPTAALLDLQWAAEEESAWLHCVCDPEGKLAIAELVAEGDRRQWASAEFRQELSKWVHPSRQQTRDGIPGYARSVDDLLSYDGPLVVRTFDMGDGQAAQDHELATESPALAILGTECDNPHHWLLAGLALQHLLLRATTQQIYASFLNQAIEVPDLRGRLPAIAGRGGFPQAILRLGFGEDIKPTPRRELQEVLI